MPAELLIRPVHSDHIVVADLIAPGGAGRSLGARSPISRLVLDAPLAAGQAQYAEDARAAGLPLAIDPMTFLLQGITDPARLVTAPVRLRQGRIRGGAGRPRRPTPAGRPHDRL